MSDIVYVDTAPDLEVYACDEDMEVFTSPDGNTTVVIAGLSEQIAAATAAIMFQIESTGGPIAAGIKGDIYIPFECTLQSVTALGDQTGSISIDLWMDNYANAPPTVADSIVASSPVTISAAEKSHDSTLTGWTTSLPAGSIIRVYVNSNDTLQRVSIVLTVLKT